MYARCRPRSFIYEKGFEYTYVAGKELSRTILAVITSNQRERVKTPIKRIYIFLRMGMDQVGRDCNKYRCIGGCHCGVTMGRQNVFLVSSRTLRTPEKVDNFLGREDLLRRKSLVVSTGRK